MLRSLLAKVVLCSVVTVLLGSLGSIATSGAIDSWYAKLNQPTGTPPNSIFGPVWTILYIMIGTSFALMWHDHPQALGKTKPTIFFIIQMLLNLAWTPVFFGAQLIVPALLVIVLLWIFILLTIRQFARFSQLAALLLYPYLAWVTYATYLNAGHTFLN